MVGKLKERYKKAEQKALEKIDKIANKIRTSTLFKPLYEKRKTFSKVFVYGDALINTGLLYLTLRNRFLGLSSFYLYAYVKDALRVLQFFTHETKSPLGKYCLFYFSANIISVGFYAAMPFESYISLYFYIKTKDNEKNEEGNI